MLKTLEKLGEMNKILLKSYQNQSRNKNQRGYQQFKILPQRKQQDQVSYQEEFNEIFNKGVTPNLNF